MSKALSIIIHHKEDNRIIYAPEDYETLWEEIKNLLDIIPGSYKMFYRDEFDREFLISNNGTFLRAMGTTPQELEVFIREIEVPKIQERPQEVPQVQERQQEAPSLYERAQQVAQAQRVPSGNVPRGNLNLATVKTNLSNTGRTFDIEENFWNACGTGYAPDLVLCPRCSDNCPQWNLPVIPAGSPCLNCAVQEPLPVWTCQYCSMQNGETLIACQVCERPRVPVDIEEDKEVIPRAPVNAARVPVNDWTCTCKAINPLNAHTWLRCGFNRNFWNCATCYAKNPGYVMNCPSCQQGAIYVQAPGQEALFCKYCGKMGVYICGECRDANPWETREWKYCGQVYVLKGTDNWMCELCYKKLLEGSNDNKRKNERPGRIDYFK